MRMNRVSKNKNTRILCALCVFFALIFVFSTTIFAKNDLLGTKLIVGGMPFGVKFSTNGVVVTSCENVGNKKSPATLAGLRANDVIIKVNDKNVSSVDELKEQIDISNGKSINIVYLRDGKEKYASVAPIYSKDNNEYRIGVNVKDKGAGLGTVTYILPDTLEFAGLGHGICDGNSGKLVNMNRGVVNNVSIINVKRGVSGTPGELVGKFSDKKIGSLYKNTDCGVFGMFTELPKNAVKTAYVGTRDDIHDGEARIICTLDENGPSEYGIEISDIDKNANSSKCFCVKVNDKRLIEKTGGIVQGMSGSPIIQDGKLVGAVTHVCVNL